MVSQCIFYRSVKNEKPFDFIIYTFREIIFYWKRPNRMGWVMFDGGKTGIALKDILDLI